MNMPQRNRNPGNLRFANQVESVGKDEDDFAIFPTDMAGWRALVRQIKRDQGRGLTIEGFITKYAPPHENNTPAYIAYVCGGLVASPEDRLAVYSPYAICGLIAKYEGYFDE